MVKKRIKAGGAVVLAAVLAVSAFVLPKAYAARAVATEAECSVQVTAPVEEFSELKILPVEIMLYKVADINVQGEYNAIGAFESMDFSELSSETKAVEWEQMAEEAKALITEDTEETAMITLQEGTATATGLETGLYLVEAKQALSDAYQYDFKPYLISLPNNYYYSGESDDWVYELVGENAVGLKPEKTDRFGDLVIEKLLDVYNETIGGATFVFQVEAFKTDVDTGVKKQVYSDVVSMTFGAPGQDRIVIKDLPAGAEVTVTEVYTGASYELTSEASQTVTVITNGLEGAPVAVTFENTYNQEMNGGNGIVNSFTYDSETGKWTHAAAEDSTP